MNRSREEATEEQSQSAEKVNPKKEMWNRLEKKKYKDNFPFDEPKHLRRF